MDFLKKKTKSIILFVIITFCLSGCGALNTTLDIVNIFTEDSPVHYATVQAVTIRQHETIIYFTDGFNYEVKNNPNIRPGDKVQIFETEDGFKAKVVRK